MIRVPLYLHASGPLRIRLEAPALCVKAESDADRLYPLRRVERIQVSGPVEWETAALLACVDSGISIQFLDRHGQTRGRLVGCGQVNHSLAENLQRLFDRPGWRPWYRQWCWARGLQTQRYVANRLSYSYRDARDLAGLPRWCEARLGDRARPKSIRNALQWLQLDFYGLITQSLQDSGLWSSGRLALEEPIDLAGDLTHILQPVLLIVRHRELTSHDADKAIGHRQVAEWFTRNTGWFEYQVARIKNQLEIWIMETA